jgi:thymidylate synthase ThyX
MSAVLTREDRALLAPYVTSLDGSVYALRGLPEEVVAVLFAYYSRSRESLRDNLLKLIREGDLHLSDADAAADEPAADFLARAAEKARAFHEKWVVGYGHASVAEHAVVHLAIEDVSILASKAIEEARLASYTEKSTRYVRFDTARVVVPDVFQAGPAAATFRAGLEPLLATYDALMEPLTAHFVATRPRREGQSDKGHRTACQAQACDVLRYLLPAATPTNLGLTANARVLESLLAKLLSHPLAEVRAVGERMKEEAQKIVPTLIKYATASEYRADTALAMAEQAAALLGAAPAAPGAEAPPNATTVRLLRHDADAELRVVEAILAGASAASGKAVAAAARALTDEARRKLLDDYVSRRGRFDPPLRALEVAHVTFEIVVDYGAWRDLQRHRLLTIFEQRLGCDLGYETPPALEEAGLAAPFHAAMSGAASAWRALAGEYPEEAAYVVPLAYRKRAFVTMNLREAHHLIPLRSSRQGHPSYRRVAQALHAELARALPNLAAAIRVDTADYDLSRA